jgi:DNA-binding LacI/PurR family transcriptional regulator
MVVTIVDIARELNLSHTTVSSIVNGKNSLALPEATRLRVLKAAQEMGYRPNRAARALATGRNGMIGLLVCDFHRAYGSQVVRQVQQQVKARHLELLIYDTGLGLEWLKNQSGGAIWPVDGILAFDIVIDQIPWMVQGDFELPPTVSMGTMYSEKTDYVGIDLYSCAQQATEQLLQGDRQRIALLQDESTRQTASDRRRDAYVDTLRRAKRKPILMTATDQSRAASRQAIHDFVRDHPLPDAIFCINDDMAIGAYRGLCDLGLRMPEDVALIGSDGIEDTEYLPCPISTIRQPIVQMCEAAMRLLDERIAQPQQAHQKILLQPEFIARESSQVNSRSII